MIDPNKVINFNYPSIKECPWCGSAGIYQFHDLDKGNGRGYPGYYAIEIKCSNPRCEAKAPYGIFDDIYRSTQEAINKAAEAWNKRKDK